MKSTAHVGMHNIHVYHVVCALYTDGFVIWTWYQ